MTQPRAKITCLFLQYDVMFKRLDLIGRSRILERVQLCVCEVTRPSFSGRLKGVACETSSHRWAVIIIHYFIIFGCGFPVQIERLLLYLIRMY